MNFNQDDGFNLVAPEFLRNIGHGKSSDIYFLEIF